MRNSRSSLMAFVAMMAAAAHPEVLAGPLPRQATLSEGRQRSARVTLSEKSQSFRDKNAELKAEITAHNRAVEERKAEKLRRRGK